MSFQIQSVHCKEMKKEKVSMWVRYKLFLHAMLCYNACCRPSQTVMFETGRQVTIRSSPSPKASSKAEYLLLMMYFWWGEFLAVFSTQGDSIGGQALVPLSSPEEKLFKNCMLASKKTQNGVFSGPESKKKRKKKKKKKLQQNVLSDDMVQPAWLMEGSNTVRNAQKNHSGRVRKSAPKSEILASEGEREWSLLKPDGLPSFALLRAAIRCVHDAWSAYQFMSWRPFSWLAQLDTGLCWRLKL